MIVWYYIAAWLSALRVWPQLLGIAEGMLFLAERLHRMEHRMHLWTPQDARALRIAATGLAKLSPQALMLLQVCVASEGYYKPRRVAELANKLTDIPFLNRVAEAPEDTQLRLLLTSNTKELR